MPKKQVQAGARKPIRGKVRVGLIGAGGMANMVHYPSLEEMNDVEMAGLCDLDRGKARKTAKRFGIPAVYTDYRRMLDEVKPHAVYVLMPPHHLFDIAVDVMSRGHDLFIEKPPGLNAIQNRNLGLCAERNGVVAMAGFQRRYVPIIETMRNRLAKRGPLHTVVVTFVKNSLPAASYYGGAIDILSCDAVHAVDTLRHLCGGEVVSVASDIRNLGADGPNAFYALVKFSSGTTGVLQTNWACGRRFFTIEMHAQGASAYVDPDLEGRLYLDGDETGEVFDPAACAGHDAYWHRVGFYAENRHFIDCVKRRTPPLSRLTETVPTMELVDQIYHAQI